MGGSPHDLVERTYRFAADVRAFVNRLPRTLANVEDAKQLVRASGSVASNYLESQEGLSRKDFYYRIKVCRKEARESALWLSLIDSGRDQELALARGRLIDEATQLKRIFSAIVGREAGSE